MSEAPFINILIAEDNDVSREMMAGILRAQGYRVHGAIDGESAIKVISERAIDMALVDVNMAPKGGFEFVRYLVAKGNKLPVVIVTGDDSADMLMEASSLGVVQVIQKPVEPKRLTQTVERILRRKGFNPTPLAVTQHETKFSPEDLMAEVLKMAMENARAKKGGPYAALIASSDGQIIARGASGLNARVDPIAHAEVLAIRRAAEKLGTADLTNYVLYCTSQPTRVGEAVIASVGLSKVYYGLSREDIGTLQPGHGQNDEPVYEQIYKEAALEMFKNAKS
jgi:DNA-binding response OmpR family regulator